MSWEEVALVDVCEVGRGSSPRPINDTAYFEGGDIPWIKIADATASGKYIYKTKEYVNSYGASFSRHLPSNSLILATSGVSLGQVKFLGVKGCIHDGWLYLKDYNGIDKEFLYYKLISLQDYFHANSYGAAIQNINTDILRRTKVNLPPLQTQKRIADILSTYDDLIENNLKRIKLLEQAAQNIYKEWFVNLRFPGHENTPNNEETGLPMGWEKVLVNSKALYFGRGITPKYKDGSGFFGINQKVNKGSILETQHMKEFDPELNIPEKKYAHFGDVLINSLGEGTIGRVHFYSGKSVIHPVDQHMSIFRSEDLGLNLFIYLFFSSYEGQGLLASIKRGGTNMTMLNIGDLRKLEIKIPNRKTLLKLQDIVLPFFKNKNVFLNQNQKLKAARDILLPRLMNRTIEI